MTYKFGKTSKSNLSTCCDEIQRVMNRALSYGIIDFSVLEGYRSIERQQNLYREGKSQLDGVTKLSSHNLLPSEGVDVVPYPLDWDDTESFYKLATVIFKAAAEECVKLTYGGHWESFKDLPHWEIDNGR